MTEKICLVIPCYNEGKRLRIEEFKSFESNCYFIFVNDGSNDNTLDLLKDNLKDNFYLLDLKDNVGKAEAVRQGMMYMTKLPIFKEIEWVGFWDADLSTSLDELYNFINYYNNIFPKADAIWGSRINKLGSNILRSYSRYYLGRLFAHMIKLFLGIKFYDSQCGAKLFKKKLVKQVFQNPFVSKWIFDIEILLRLEEYCLVEYPLNGWKDIGGSKINFLSTLCRMPMELMKLKSKYVKKH